MRLRRLARGLLVTAVRHARPRQREWGEAILCEMDFVDADWEALCWAIGGSVAILKGTRPAAKDSTHVPGELADIEKKTRHSITYTRTLNVIEGLFFGLFIFVSPNSLARIGSCLIVISTMWFFLFQRLVRNHGAPSKESDAPDGPRLLRAGIVRERMEVVSVNMTTHIAGFVPGWLLFVFGILTSHPEIEANRVSQTAFAILILLVSLLGVLPIVMLGRACRNQTTKWSVLSKETR